MRRRGWQPGPDRPFDAGLEGLCTRVAVAMHNTPDGPFSIGVGPDVHSSNFRDCYRGVIDGRAVTVANAWLRIHDRTLSRAQSFHGTSVCAVELATLVPPVCIQPRRFRPAMAAPDVATGDAAFDAQYLVRGLPESLPMLGAEVCQLILARDDWVFVAEGRLLACVGRGAFIEVEEVHERIGELMQIVRAIPGSAMPGHIDHSVDDLLRRIAAIDDIPGAMAFLQSLSDEDRQRLANSDTPLAAMADVRTPDEAIRRLQTMDTARRAQLLAMFARVNDDQRR